MARFINPFTDVGFKRIFGQEINKDLLMDFLNSLFEGEKRITDITFLDKEMLGFSVEDRSCIYDIYCTNEDGEHFIVEMQNRGHVNFRERALFYLSQAIVRQGEKGVGWLFDLKAVYGIFFMNFRLGGLGDKLRTDVLLADRDTHQIFTDKMRYVFLQLPFFQKDETSCETDFERWIYILKNMDTLQRMPFKLRKAVFQRLEDIVDIASLSKEDRIKYDESIKVYRDNLVTEAYALQKGRTEGRAEGFLEANRRNARAMKAKGLPVELIAEITGLSVQEINDLDGK